MMEDQQDLQEINEDQVHQILEEINEEHVDDFKIVVGEEQPIAQGDGVDLAQGRSSCRPQIDWQRVQRSLFQDSSTDSEDEGFQSAHDQEEGPDWDRGEGFEEAEDGLEEPPQFEHSQIYKLEKTIESIRRSEANLKKHNKKLNQENNKLRIENKRLNTRLNTELRDIQSFQQQLDREREEFGNDLALSKSRNDELQSRINQMKRKETTLTNQLREQQQQVMSLNRELQAQIQEIFQLRELKQKHDNEKAVQNQLKNMSQIFSVLHQFTDPESSEDHQLKALSQLSDCCTNLRQSHNDKNKISKDSQQECQICSHTFPQNVNFLFTTNEGQDPTTLNSLCKQMCPDRKQRRVALSCGHDIFHQDCIKQWFNQSMTSQCPICRAPATNIKELE